MSAADNPSRKEIYVDNAATSYPKPPSVEAALLHFYRDLGASAGRGAYPRAMLTGRMLDETRRLLGQLFNVRKTNQFIFTLNATDAPFANGLSAVPTPTHVPTTWGD